MIEKKLFDRLECALDKKNIKLALFYIQMIKDRVTIVEE